MSEMGRLERFELGYARTALRRNLVAAVLSGDKTATASLLAEYEPATSEPLPLVGQHHLLVGYDDEPIAIVETTEVRILPAADVDLQFARDEGEGFETVAAWLAAHERFWQGHVITHETPIVCQRFRLVQTLEAERRFDLSAAKATAVEVAREWGLELGEPFALSYVSYVAPAGRAVLKVSWEGDQESLHEGDALELWDGEGAVRLLRRSGRALLEERAVPGDDLSTLPDDEATAIAIDIAARLWRRVGSPFRPVASEVTRWLDNAEREGSELVPHARKLLADLDPGVEWLVHGDFHHHNVLRRGDRYVAIDPKPYLADREYDVPSFLWNPRGNRMEDREQTERRIAAFVAAGLDDSRIRAWTVIRGAYLRPDYASPIRALIEPFERKP